MIFAASTTEYESGKIYAAEKNICYRLADYFSKNATAFG